MHKSFSKSLVVAALVCASLTANAGSIQTNDMDIKWHPNNELGTLLDALDVDDPISCAKTGCGGGAVTLPTPQNFVVEARPFGKKLIKVKPHTDDFLVWLNGTRLFDARAGSSLALGDRSPGLANIAWISSLQIPSKDHSEAMGSDIVSSTDSAVSVPEPGTIGLLGLALLGLAFARRRQRRLH